MGYKLKKNVEAFEMVDGPLTGRKFKAGEVYDSIPPQYAGRFDAIEPDKPEKSKVAESGQPTKDEVKK